MMRFLLLLVCLAALSSTPAAAEIWSRAAWSGGSGPAGNVIDPVNPAALPVASFEGGVTGRLTMRFTAPRAPSTMGSYTAQLVLREGSVTRTYRGLGAVAADGTISDHVWRSAAAGTQVRVTLRRPLGDPQALYLLGQAVAAGGTTFPLFALPRLFDPRKNPLEGAAATGRFNAFFREALQTQGTGTGVARIDAGGAVRLAATLGDLRPLTSAATVLSAGDGTRFFLAAQPVARGGFLGAWFILAPARPDADWAGRGLGPGSSSSPTTLDVFLSAYTKPARGSNALPWMIGVVDVDAPQVEGSASQVASGEVGWRSAMRLAALVRAAPGTAPALSTTGLLNGANAFNVRLLNLAINPATGRASGRLRYFYFKSSALNSPVAETPHITTLVGAVNQKSGQIEGLVRPRVRGGSTGLLLVSPQ
jgi:hypothetical protein